MCGGECYDRDRRIEIGLRARGVQATGGMGIDRLPARLARPAHSLRHVVALGARAREQSCGPLTLGVGELHRAGGIEALHLRRQRQPISATKIEQQAFEIGADLDVHRRGDGRLDAAGRIIAAGQRAVEDVVDVGGHDQPLDRQAHLRRDIAGEHIAEVARGHRKRDLAMRCAKLERCGKVIHHLRHQPRPVDRVDRREAQPGGHRRIAEHPFHHRLAIVEAGAFDRDVVDVGGQHRGHLAALDVADAALGVEHEDLHSLAPGHRIDRRRSGIAAGRAHDRQRGVAFV